MGRETRSLMGWTYYRGIVVWLAEIRFACGWTEGVSLTPTMGSAVHIGLFGAISTGVDTSAIDRASV